MICFYTYRGKDSNFVHSSFVELGDNFYLPEDVTVFDEADDVIKETVKRLVEIDLAEQKDCVLVEIGEFDNGK